MKRLPDLREVVVTARGLGFESHGALLASPTTPARILLCLGTAAAMREARAGAFEFIGEAEKADGYPALLADVLTEEAGRMCGRGEGDAEKRWLMAVTEGAMRHARQAMDEAFDRIYRLE